MPIALPTAGQSLAGAERSPISSSSRTAGGGPRAGPAPGVVSSSRSRSSSAALDVVRSPTASVNAQTEPGTASATSARTSSTADRRRRRGRGRACRAPSRRSASAGGARRRPRWTKPPTRSARSLAAPGRELHARVRVPRASIQPGQRAGPWATRTRGRCRRPPRPRRPGASWRPAPFAPDWLASRKTSALPGATRPRASRGTRRGARPSTSRAQPGLMHDGQRPAAEHHRRRDPLVEVRELARRPCCGRRAGPSARAAPRLVAAVGGPKSVDGARDGDSSSSPQK